MPAVGEQFGRYKILRKLGEGGWGTVYAALDTQLRREVALKLLPDDRARDPGFQQRFQREAQVVASLHHPNIVTLYSAEECDGRLFLTMELIEGETLREVIRTDPFELSSFIDRSRSLADALRASHLAGVVHRDVKPDNVMVDRDGRTRVLDFGLAKMLDDGGHPTADGAHRTTASMEDASGPRTATGQILGTVAYMSPEQARGEAVDHRSDIFSLGAVMYEMATRTEAFHGETIGAVRKAILERDPPPPSRVQPGVPESLDGVILRALAKDRAARYQSAEELIADLEALQESERAAMSAGSPWRRALPLGGIGLAAAIIFGVTLRGGGERPPEFARSQLTSAKGMEVCPSWSPQGDRIAYSSTARGPLDIYILELGDSTPRLRESSDGDDFAASWSPDKHGIAFVSGREMLAGLYLMDAAAGPARKLADIGLPCSEQIDTLFQVLGAQPWRGTEVLFSRPGTSGWLALWKIDVQSMALTQVTDPPPGSQDVQASWHPSGERIVFRRRGTKSEIYTADPAGRDLRLLIPDDGADNSSPAWSPHGEHVYFVSNRSGRGTLDLWRVDADGAEDSMVEVTEEQLLARWPAVSASGGKVCYSLFQHQTDLCVLDLDTGESEWITDNTKDNFGARFSSDGSTVVFHSSMSGNHEIWLVDLREPAGSAMRLRRLTHHDSEDIYPDVSPDGDIVFLSNRDGPFRMWKMAPDGRNPVRISEQAIPVNKAAHYVGRSEWPRWAPDGKAIGYLAPSRIGSVLRRVDPRDGSVESVKERIYSFGWYLDSDRCIYLTTNEETGEPELWVTRLSTGEKTHLLDDHCAEIAVSNDGRTVTYCRAVSHANMQLVEFELTPPDPVTGLPSAAGEPRVLTAGQGRWHVHNGGLSPDGRSVVYTRDTDEADLHLLEPTD